MLGARAAHSLGMAEHQVSRDGVEADHDRVQSKTEVRHPEPVECESIDNHSCHRQGHNQGVKPFPHKPKGMRWTTFERLRKEREALEREILVGSKLKLSRLRIKICDR